MFFCSLYNNIDKCLDLSIITVFFIKVPVSRDGSLKGKLCKLFEFKLRLCAHGVYDSEGVRDNTKRMRKRYALRTLELCVQQNFTRDVWCKHAPRVQLARVTKISKNDTAHWRNLLTSTVTSEILG